MFDFELKMLDFAGLSPSAVPTPGNSYTQQKPHFAPDLGVKVCIHLPRSRYNGQTYDARLETPGWTTATVSHLLVYQSPACFTDTVRPQSLQLDTLILSNNSLTTLPDQLKHCPNLRVLQLDGNEITQLPSAAIWSAITNLESVDLSGNQLIRFDFCI